MDSQGRKLVMRTVSFVEHMDLDFKGNVIPQTLLLADVDNDMINELIVGNIEGEIVIFKGDSTCQPWKRLSVSGMLTCLAVGEVLLGKKNSLVCMTAEGWCYVYNISPLSSSLPGISCDESTERAILSQELPANARVMCLADIDMDGHIEMVIGYSDRLVRAFRWQEFPDSSSGHFILLQKWQLAGQIGSITTSVDSCGVSQLMVSQPGGSFVTLRVRPSNHHVKSENQTTARFSDLRHSGSMLERSGSFASGTRLISTSKLNFSAQSIDLAGIRDSPCQMPMNVFETVSSHSDISTQSLENINLKVYDGARKLSRPELQKSVSDADQPSSRKGSCLTECSSDEDLSPRTKGKHTRSVEKLEQVLKTLNIGEALDIPNGAKQYQGHHSSGLDSSFDNDPDGIVYHPVMSQQARSNEDSSTFIIGRIRKSVRGDGEDKGSAHNRQEAESTYYALATLSGSFMLADEDNILWSLHVGHDLFALSKLDITGDGQEEVVGCSWNGQTYIINHKQEIVSYHFPDSLTAFCAGYYSVNERLNVPCLVYATTGNHIYIYHNIGLPHLESTNLMETLAATPDMIHLLQQLGIQADDHTSLRKLYNWCLYGKHRTEAS